MKDRKLALALAGVLSAVTVVSSVADDYSYYVSGYPAENPSSSMPSPGIDLETSTRTCSLVADELEARYRTWLESPGINLKTTPRLGMCILVK